MTDFPIITDTKLQTDHRARVRGVHSCRIRYRDLVKNGYFGGREVQIRECSLLYKWHALLIHILQGREQSQSEQY